MPFFIIRWFELSALDLDIHATGQVEAHKRVDRLVRRLQDVDEPVVGAKLEVLHRLLVDVWTTNYAKASNVRGKRNRPANSGAGPLGRVGDLLCGLVDNPVIVCSKSNSYFHSCLDIRG